MRESKKIDQLISRCLSLYFFFHLRFFFFLSCPILVRQREGREKSGLSPCIHSSDTGNTFFALSRFTAATLFFSVRPGSEGFFFCSLFLPPELDFFSLFPFSLLFLSFFTRGGQRKLTNHPHMNVLRVFTLLSFLCRNSFHLQMPLYDAVWGN